VSEIDLSILVATTPRRRAFWPWLAWNIKRQVRNLDSSLRIEVVACGDHTSERPYLLMEFGDAIDFACRHFDLEWAVFTPFGTEAREPLTLGMKRQWLQQKARGTFIAWADDDDLYPAGWWRAAATTLSTKAVSWVASPGITYYDLMSGKVWRPRAWRDAPIPITAVVRRECSPDFPLEKSQAEDVEWFRQLSAEPGVVLPFGTMVALVHPQNTSQWLYQKRVQRSFVEASAVSVFDPETVEQLEALKQRLLSQEK
jgi:hypothetical protein